MRLDGQLGFPAQSVADRLSACEFVRNDPDNPRNWTKWTKLMNMLVVIIMDRHESVLSPMRSSMAYPGLSQIAESLVRPLVLPSLCMTIGRRPVYMFCITAFVTLRIPAALAKSLPLLVSLCSCSFTLLTVYLGLGVALANGGGTISDMPYERATIYGIYMLVPLIGPDIEQEDTRALQVKLAQSFKRPLKIMLTQPIVFMMSIYFALIISVIYEEEHGFKSLRLGCVYIIPCLGLVAAALIIPKIDSPSTTSQKSTTSSPNQTMGRTILSSLAVTLVPTFLTMGQAMLGNCVRNCFVDSFERWASSALAGGNLFSYFTGGFIPVFNPLLLRRIGYGWGFLVFAGIAVLTVPMSVLFYIYGARLRQRFMIVV
ncbi:hypothetical protein BJ878DRAFT_582603 [Calycina marina]|uniref:MFS transporter n=1 Tax=Calycina marina TaxID=1763456 RepID=A0A9P7Z322_9HELO|nr:hypothetical protein BJ878DRAFT_582603 [Calycina marina]